MAHVEQGGLRNPELEAFIDEALQGDDKKLIRFLLQNTNLKGQPATPAFAVAFSDAIAAQGERADDLIQSFLNLTHRDLGGERAEANLHALMAHVLTARILRQKRSDEEWEILMDLAGDARKVVRDSVVAGLARLTSSPEVGLDSVMESCTSWMDGYLQACVVLEMLGTKAVLSELKEGGIVEERLREALRSAVDAPRSATRSQGRRTLLTVLSQVLPVYAQRFPTSLEWMVEDVGGKDPDVLELWERVLEKLVALGVQASAVDVFRRSMDGSRGQRRDPRSYVGTTRGRGRKAGKRAEWK